MRIFKVDVSKLKITSEYLKDNLPKNCLFEATKYKQENDLYRSLIAWYTLSNVLKEYYDIDISCKTINHNEYKKPYIDGIHFNISHSGNLVFVCVSNNECGIDVQIIGKSNLLKHKNKLLTDSEIALLDTYHSYKKEEIITRLFSKKEAYLKMIGTGITKEGLYTIDNTSVIDMIIADSNNTEYVLSVSQIGINLNDLQITEVDF
jgi:4'-phosphopantetheinyl transferase